MTLLFLRGPKTDARSRNDRSAKRVRKMHSHSSQSTRTAAALRRRIARGFTMIELLVVIALVVLLSALVFVAFKGVSTSAQQLESSNALRDMITGYISYTTDNNGRLMPGYIAPGDFGDMPGQVDLKLAYADERAVELSAGDSGSYVWRLLPYLSNEWKTLTVDYGSDAFDSRIAAEVAGNVFGPDTRTPGSSFGLGMTPAFGLNSAFFGGDSFHGGSVITDFAPWNNLGNETIAATRMAQVRNMSNAIVFAPTAMALPPGDFSQLLADDVVVGSAELRAPFVTQVGDDWADAQWIYDSGPMGVAVGGASFGNFGGVPLIRADSDVLPTAHLDGSTGRKKLGQLAPNGGGGSPASRQAFMSHWSPFVTGVFR